MSSYLPYIDTDELNAQRDEATIIKYDAEMRRRVERDATTPNVQWFPGFAFVDKRPKDAELADGKKQRVFYMPYQAYGIEAARKSALAQINRGRPEESRAFPEDPTW